MAQLICSDLTIGYDSRTVISNLNFTVESGEYICIVGENGSGKSTLMKTILGLQSPIAGKVVFSDGLKKNEIGYLPQQTQAQRDFPASVSEIVVSGFQGKCGIKPFYTKAQKQEAEKSMEKLNILHLAKSSYRELSGGQQQRVLLARALCSTSKILLLDEPVSGLDPKVSAEMYQLIYDLNKNDKITVIMISHDITAALKYSDKILHIDKDIFFGTKSEYLNSNLGHIFNNTKDGDI